MAFVCSNCGKSIVSGISRRHGRGVAGKRWKTRAQKTARLFKPNLQLASIAVDGIVKKMRLCTKCLKKYRKEGKLPVYANVASL